MGFERSVFLVISLLCVLYFTRRRVVDPLLVGFVSSLIYFFPALLGEIGFSYGGANGSYFAPVVPGAYVAMFIVLVSVTGGAWAYDLACGRTMPVIDLKVPTLPYVLLGISLVGALVSFWTVGKGYLCTEKSDVLARIDGWYYIAAYAAPLAFVSSVAAGKRGVACVAAVILAADLFIGFRAGASIAMISIGLLFGSWLFDSRRRQVAYVALLLVAGCALLVVKQLAWNLKYVASVPCEQVTAGLPASAPVPTPAASAPLPTPAANTRVPAPAAISPALEVAVRPEQVGRVASLLAAPDTYVAAFRYAEPMVIQAILNEVVKVDFKTPAAYVSAHILSGVPGGKTLFGIDVTGTPSFNDLFQRALFPMATFGMANNPWAQAYSAGGHLMVVFFSAVYVLMLGAMSWMFSACAGPVKGAIAVVVGWWAFYLHRNDVLIQVGIMKMVIYILLVALLISLVLAYLAKKKVLFSVGDR